jgi:hypothetical protein
VLVILLFATAVLHAQSGESNKNDLTTGQYVYRKATCKAIVVFHGQELSGRMIFKQTAEDTVLVAFFNELGVSYVEGGLSVGSRESGVGSQESGVGSSETANGEPQTANGQRPTANGFEFVKLAPFLDYKSFRKHFEKGLLEMLFDTTTGTLVLPEYSSGRDVERIYEHGRKFIMKCNF